MLTEVFILPGDVEKLKKFKIRVEDPPGRKDMVFLGGSVLANVAKDKPDWWISREEYLEQGAKILDKLAPTVN